MQLSNQKDSDVDVGKRAVACAIKDVESYDEPESRRSLVTTKQSSHSDGFFRAPASAKSAFLPTSSHHKAVLEIPFEYISGDGYASDATGLYVQHKSRLSSCASFPVYDHRSVMGHRQEVTCLLSSASGLRGKAGYTTGSADLRFSHHHDCAKQKRKSGDARFTTVIAGIGLQPKMELPPVNSNYNSAIPALRVGICTTSRHADENPSSSLSANLNFPKLATEPSHCLLSLSGRSQRRLLKYHGRRQIDVQTLGSTTLDPVSQQLRSLNATVSLTPVSLSSSGSAFKPGLGKPNWILRLGCSKSKENIRPLIGFSVSFLLPKMKSLCSRKLLELSVQWKGVRSWQLGGMWTHMAETTATAAEVIKQPCRQIGVGVTLNSSGSEQSASSCTNLLSWIFTWTEGDFTLRIPILLSSSAPTLYYNQASQFFYLSFLSSIIQDVIGYAFMPLSKSDNKHEDQEQHSSRNLSQQKAREDALLQQSFMERQAKTRMALEKQRNGLVIRRAVYYLHRDRRDVNGSTSLPEVGDDALDVTIPLQFWVSPTESSLELYGAAHRGSMLGFYDIAAAEQTTSSRNRASVGAEERTQTATWPDFFLSFWWENDVEFAKHEQHAAVPQLLIQYDFDRCSYEIIVGNDEEISLPSTRARLLIDQ